MREVKTKHPLNIRSPSEFPQLPQWLQTNLVLPLRIIVGNINQILRDLRYLCSLDSNKNFPALRNTILQRLATISRTYYHTGLVIGLRERKVFDNLFEEELNLSYWRGAFERNFHFQELKKEIKSGQDIHNRIENLKRLIERIKSFNNRLSESFDQTKSFLNDYNEDYSKLILQDDYSEFRTFNPRTLRVLRIILQLIPDAQNLIEKFLSDYERLENEYLERIFTVYRKELDATEKILDLVELYQKTMDLQQMTDVAQIIDTISWGFQDFHLIQTLQNIMKSIDDLNVRYAEPLTNILHQIELWIPNI